MKYKVIIRMFFILFVLFLINCKSNVDLDKIYGTYKIDNGGYIKFDSYRKTYKKYFWGINSEIGNYSYFNNIIILKPTYVDTMFSKYSDIGFMQTDSIGIRETNDSLFKGVVKEINYSLGRDGIKLGDKESQSLSYSIAEFKRTSDDFEYNSLININYWKDSIYHDEVEQLWLKLGINYVFYDYLVLRYVNAAIRMYPDSLVLFAIRAHARFQLGEYFNNKDYYELAYYDFNKLSLNYLLRNPFNAHRYALTYFYARPNDIQHVINLCESIIESILIEKDKLKDNHSLLNKTYRLLAVCYFNLGQNSKACNILERAVNNDDEVSFQLLKKYCK